LRSENYRVVAREGTDVYEFLINVCRPLVVSNTTCPSAAAVCQTKPSDPTFGTNTGSNVTLAVDPTTNQLILTASAGEVCPGKGARQTQIYFECDLTASAESKPVYVDELSNCTYLFRWNTPFACPLNRNTTPPVTGDCKAPSFSVSGSYLDFSPLSTQADSTGQVDSQVFHWRVCGAASSCNGASACIVNNNT